MFAQRNALLFLHISRREVRDPTAQEVNHDTDKQVAQCKVDVVKSKRRDSVCDTQIDEQLTGVDMREHAVKRVTTSANEKADRVNSRFENFLLNIAEDAPIS